MSSNKKDKSTQRPQLSLKWTKGLPTSQVEEVEKRLLENGDLFLLLDNILEGMVVENRRARNSRSSYSMPAWSEFQADANAVDRTIDKVRTLLKFTKGNDNV